MSQAERCAGTTLTGDQGGKDLFLRDSHIIFSNGMSLSVGSVCPPVQVVTWVCDPVHGNTESVNGFKTRRYENIRAEVEAFFDVHDQMGSVPGGVHLEMTGASQGATRGRGWAGGRGQGMGACWGRLLVSKEPLP